MILVSNHLLNLEQFIDIKDVVIRVNMAYVRDCEELTRFVDVDYDIFLDYPCTRTKPPTPTLSYLEAIQATHIYPSIKYFAASNIESSYDVDKWIGRLPATVEFVPKIETRKGVEALSLICPKVNYVMLDSEDLYTDVGGDSDLYLTLRDKVVQECKDVTLLELYGVVFAES